MRISFTSSGSTKRLESSLQKMQKFDIRNVLERYGQEGVRALSAATPKESGLAATAWSYKVEIDRDSAGIVWHNTNVENGFPVAIMLQYGYGTGTGGYVQGRDYINPAMRPIFDRIANEVWKEVMSA